MKKKVEIEKYIKLVYDKDSQLNKIEDLRERKETAAIKAGLDIADPDVLQKLINLKGIEYREKIINYLQKSQPNAYIKLIADQQLFLNMQEKLLKPIDDGDDTSELMKISSQSEELLERIDRIKKKIYMEHELIEEAENKIRVMTPERRLREKTNSSANNPPTPDIPSVAV